MLFPLPVGLGDIELGLLDALLGGEGFEQVAATFEDRLQRRDQQRLTEPAGTAEEIGTTLRYHLVDKRSLVDIEIPVFAKFLKALYSYRIFSLHCHYFSLNLY